MKHMSRIIACILLPALLLSGCRKFTATIKVYDERISELENVCSTLNDRVTALERAMAAIKANDHVIAVFEMKQGDKVIGHTIVFAKSKPVTIFNGSFSSAPVVGVAIYEDGEYYWTLDGEWLRDAEGNMIRAVGDDAVVPLLKIEDGWWHISVDGGITWTKVAEVSAGTGPDGQDHTVTQDDDNVYITFNDGTVIVLPRHPAPTLTISLSVEDGELAAIPGKEVRIGYSVSGSAEFCLVTASSDGKYRISSIDRSSGTEGTITVACPSPYVDGFVNVIVSDGKGATDVKVVDFYEGRIQLPQGLEYTVTAVRQTLSIPMKFNFDYELDMDGNATAWISEARQTKDAGMRDGEILLEIAENTGSAQRQGQVRVCVKDSPDAAVATVTIIQARPLSGNIEAVDLGLPSGTLWASMNLGASSPEEYGGHYAWGETSVKESYTNETYLWTGMGAEELMHNHVINADYILMPEHDAASVNLGGKWRLPTEAEMLELIEQCSWEMETIGTITGAIITGTNGNSIFLPSAGSRSGTNHWSANSYGYYSSSSNGAGHASGYGDCMVYLTFKTSRSLTQIYCLYNQQSRDSGYSVRPVCSR